MESGLIRMLPLSLGENLKMKLKILILKVILYTLDKMYR